MSDFRRLTHDEQLIGAGILQVKNGGEDWSVMISSTYAGEIAVQQRRGARKVVATDMAGKSIDIRVRDNGHDYEVYANGALEVTGSWARPSGGSSFRWGMYVGATEVERDGMIFVTGATVDP